MEVVKESLDSIGSEKREAPIPVVGHKPDSTIRKSDDTKLFQGYITLETVSPYDQEKGGVPEWLARVYGLKVISTSSYPSGNRWIVKHTIELEHPMPLLEILRAIPAVKDIADYDENIVITLR